MRTISQENSEEQLKGRKTINPEEKSAQVSLANMYFASLA